MGRSADMTTASAPALRAIVEYASTVWDYWDASGAGLALLEQVQPRVLRRVLRAPGTGTSTHALLQCSAFSAQREAF